MRHIWEFQEWPKWQKNEYSIPAERQVERADGLFGREEVRLGSDCSEGKGRVDGVSKTFAQNTEHIHNLEFEKEIVCNFASSFSGNWKGFQYQTCVKENVELLNFF